jgi:hypothetical protein
MRVPGAGEEAHEHRRPALVVRIHVYRLADRLVLGDRAPERDGEVF